MSYEELCRECEESTDPNRERESSGYCPAVCDNCGGCLGMRRKLLMNNQGGTMTGHPSGNRPVHPYR